MIGLPSGCQVVVRPSVSNLPLAGTSMARIAYADVWSRMPFLSRGKYMYLYMGPTEVGSPSSYDGQRLGYVIG